VVTLTSSPAYGAARTLFAKAIPNTPTTFSANRSLLSISDGTGSNRDVIYHVASTGTAAELTIVGGVQATNLPGVITNVWSRFTSSKLATALAVGDAAMAGNGTLTTSAIGSLVAWATLTQTHLGDNGGSQGQWNGYVERIAIWPTTRISNAQLQAMTR